MHLEQSGKEKHLAFHTFDAFDSICSEMNRCDFDSCVNTFVRTLINRGKHTHTLERI